MAKLFSFAESVKGSSHELNGKPCQDFAMKWNSEDECIHILVLSDGHGSDTYVRSHEGSRLACEITIEALKRFSEDATLTKYFLDRAGALTARPWNNPLKSANGKTVKYEELGESQQEIVRQNLSYAKGRDGIEQQDEVLNALFKSIFDQWKTAINQHFEANPLNEIESECLGNNNIEKAYGCTLLAYLQTPLYWLAFQIGDGKILTCDRNMKWTEPVPWDCRCFLNITTSLCDSHQPWNSFRYAFNGKGEFPAGVYLGSDGIDDSWGTIDHLKKFYSQITEIFVNNANDAEGMLPGLKDYLSKLSHDASHDDMSVAALLKLDALSYGIELFKLRIKGRELHEKIANIEQKIEHHLQEIEDTSPLATIRQKTLFLLDELKRLIANKELSPDFSIEDWGHCIDDFKQKVQINHRQVFEGKKEKEYLQQQENELKEKHANLVARNLEIEKDNLNSWQQIRDEWLDNHKALFDVSQSTEEKTSDDKTGFNEEPVEDNDYHPIARNRSLTDYVDIHGFPFKVIIPHQ